MSAARIAGATGGLRSTVGLGIAAAVTGAPRVAVRSGGLIRGIRARRDGLRHLDGHIHHRRDDEHDNAHRGHWPQPAKPVAPAARAVTAGWGHEPLAGQAELPRDPVCHCPQAVGRAQAQPGPHRADPGNGYRKRGAELRLDPLQAIGGRLKLLGCGPQYAAQHHLVIMHGVAHASRSSTVRSVAIALAV
jgi:hypothetical protein